jgi:hypothetical protein
MQQSPTAIPSVITVENTDGHILPVKFSRENCFLVRFAVGVGFLFLISDGVSDRTGNY